jgi:hypothetical protein
VKANSKRKRKTAPAQGPPSRIPTTLREKNRSAKTTQALCAAGIEGPDKHLGYFNIIADGINLLFEAVDSQGSSEALEALREIAERVTALTGRIVPQDPTWNPVAPAAQSAM